MSAFLLAVLLAPAPDAGTSSELENAIDQAAGTATNQAAPPPTNPLVRAFQSLNPDVSVIVDANAGYETAQPYSVAGDDPVLRGFGPEHPAGFTLQEIEAAFQATVDPYFRADVFLTIPNLQALEVEEAMVTTTGLPFGLQVKGGIFRSAFGRNNSQHLHVQDFTRRPLTNEAYLGVDGLRSPGAQVSWLIPVPFFAQLSFEAFSVAPPESAPGTATFGAGKPTDFTYTGELKMFAPATDSLSIYGGLNWAMGRTPGFSPTTFNARSVLEGVDLYVKYKPPNVTGGYFNLAWTTEYYVRQIFGTGALEAPTIDGGLYTQLVVQLARRWSVGVREDILGLPSSAAQTRVLRTGASLTFAFSEFARLRWYGEVEHPFAVATTLATFLQLEISIGAHGAHPF
jgi:hypothetical protein